MSDVAIELADRMRDAGPAVEWTPAGEVVKGDRVRYVGLAVIVTDIWQATPSANVIVHYSLGDFEGRFSVPPTWPLARLVAEQPTAPCSEHGAADRADDTAQNGA